MNHTFTSKHNIRIHTPHNMEYLWLSSRCLSRTSKNRYAKLYIFVCNNQDEQKQTDLLKSESTYNHWSGQIIIFEHPRFPWNPGISLPKPPFRVRSCEVAIIWPELISWNLKAPTIVDRSPTSSITTSPCYLLLSPQQFLSPWTAATWIPSEP